MVTNRAEQCNDNHGGISNIYLFEYMYIPLSQFRVTNNILELFPQAVIHEIKSKNISFTESIDIEDGGVVYSQTGGFDISKVLPTDNFKDLASKDWRIIVKDNNGFYRLIGLHTGVKLKFTKELGVNLSDFNGFKFSFETKEENTAPFITNLDGFIIENYRYMTYNTYAEMIAGGMPITTQEIRVLNDENKGIENTTYIWYPDGERLWVASTSDN